MTPFSVLKYIFHRFENHYIKTVFCNIWENIARVFDKNYEKKSIYLPFILLCNIDSSKERDKSKISLERIGIKNVINTTFYTFFSEKLIMIPSIKVFTLYFFGFGLARSVRLDRCFKYELTPVAIPPLHSMNYSPFSGPWNRPCETQDFKTKW